jgi:hypothetical protein
MSSYEKLNKILLDWSQNICESNSNLVSIIQFGSSCLAPLKKETDVDIIYIFDLDQKPTRENAYSLVKDFDELLERRLKELKENNLIVNSHVKTVNQLDHLSPIFLDLPTCSNILFDNKGVAKNLMMNISNWIKKNGAIKIQKGNLWYWIYDNKPPNEPVDFKF